MWRRVRGLIGTTLLACIPWTVLGLIAGVVLQFHLIPRLYFFPSYPLPGGVIVVGGLVGAIIGAINGLTFGALLLAAERGRSLDDVRGWRFAAWGTLATAGTLGLIFHSVIAAGVGGVFGAIGGMGALWLARRARQSTKAETLDPVIG